MHTLKLAYFLYLLLYIYVYHVIYYLSRLYMWLPLSRWLGIFFLLYLPRKGKKLRSRYNIHIRRWPLLCLASLMYIIDEPRYLLYPPQQSRSKRI